MNLTLSIHINPEGNDFPESDLALMLAETSRKVAEGQREGLIRDINGNRVGTFLVQEV